jgi:glycyl-tRNA synthetase
MSESLWGLGGLRFWNEKEIRERDDAIKNLDIMVQDSLKRVNKHWEFRRIESPMLIPGLSVSSAYTDDDVFFTRDGKAMRPETTAGSYVVAKRLQKQGMKLPLCVWQSGKSFRVEKNDGASASKLRFNEFTQAEWQCIYSKGTMADYRPAVEEAMLMELRWLCRAKEARIVPSDRLPAYSQQTNDVEILRPNGKWTEVCSISTRTDYDDDSLVLEVAVGIDRVVEIANEFRASSIPV